MWEVRQLRPVNSASTTCVNGISSCKTDRSLWIHQGCIDRDGFLNLVGSTIEQMLSTKVATMIEKRLKTLCGGEITPETLSAHSPEEIKTIGVSMRKAKNLNCLAIHVTNKDLDTLADKDDKEVYTWLTALPGIGEWTVHMFMIFHLNRLDISPVSDLTFHKSFNPVRPL